MCINHFTHDIRCWSLNCRFASNRHPLRLLCEFAFTTFTSPYLTSTLTHIYTTPTRSTPKIHRIQRKTETHRTLNGSPPPNNKTIRNNSVLLSTILITGFDLPPLAHRPARPTYQTNSCCFFYEFLRILGRLGTDQTRT